MTRVTTRTSKAGGAIGAGVLQLQSNAPLDTTLRKVADQANTVSPLQLSTTQVASVFSADAGMYISKGGTYEVINYFGNSLNTIAAANTNKANTFDFYIGNNGATHGARLSSLGNLSVGIGTTAASARLHVRGDGTNAVARFENNAASQGFIVGSTGSINPISPGEAVEGITTGYNGGFMLGGGVGSWRKGSGLWNEMGSGYVNGWRFSAPNNTSTAGDYFIIGTSQTFSAAAGSANFRPISIAYTINNSGAQSGTATGIYLNATYAGGGLNGMNHYLMDLNADGTNRFRVFSDGTLSATGTIAGANLQANGSGNIYFATRSVIKSPSDGIITLTNSAGSDFTRVQFGGTGPLYPAIKRNGTGFDFRFADDSAYSNITASGITTRQNSSGANMIVHVDNSGVNKFATHMSSGNLYFYNYATTLNVYSIGANDSINFGNVVAVASAKVQIDSTTQGFLPPRMTTVQKTAITTPAKGLIVFDDTLSKICVYNGSAWETVTSV